MKELILVMSVFISFVGMCQADSSGVVNQTIIGNDSLRETNPYVKMISGEKVFYDRIFLNTINGKLICYNGADKTKYEWNELKSAVTGDSRQPIEDRDQYVFFQEHGPARVVYAERELQLVYIVQNSFVGGYQGSIGGTSGGVVRVPVLGLFVSGDLFSLNKSAKKQDIILLEYFSEESIVIQYLLGTKSFKRVALLSELKDEYMQKRFIEL